MAALFASDVAMIVLTGALVAAAAALLGTFLVLRGNAMIADAISHAIVLGIVVVWLATHVTSGPVQLVGAAVTGVVTVFLIEALAASRRVKPDAAIGLVFPALFAIGVLLLNLYARDVHIDTHTVLLGEIGFVWLDTMSVAGVEVPRAVVWMSLITVINAAFVLAFFKELKLGIFDRELAVALGLAPTALFYALFALTSTTAVAAFDAVGAVLFVAFVIVPPAAAYMLTDRLVPMLLLAVVIGVAASLSGYPLALALDVSIGGMMAVMTGVFFAVAFLCGPRHGLLAQVWRHRQQRYADESRALVVHLQAHEGGARAGEENQVPALEQHLGWSPVQAQRILRRSLRRGLVLREGERLHLTERGRATARELVEPWSARGRT